MDKSSNSKTLHLFTSNYPYGNGEDYIANEVSVLSSKFNRIVIISTANNGIKRVTPKNVFPFSPTLYSKKKRISILISNLPTILSLFFIELKNNEKRYKIIINFRYYFTIITRVIYKYSFFISYLQAHKIKNGIFYSFWMGEWATVLSIAKFRGKIDQYICRVNGFDFREKEHINGLIFPRQFQLMHVNKIAAVSKYAFNEICTLYPKHIDKFDVCRLGVFDHGLNPKTDSNIFKIVSCSLLTDIKRVEKIPIILKEIKYLVHWVHFGDGNYYQKVENACKSLPSNISYELKGLTDNNKVINYYKNEHVDLFIQLSRIEGGVPISIQEAASFGIPVLATNVGGIPEVVNSKTGWLIDKNFDIINTANIISDIILNPSIQKKKSEAIRDHFVKNYNAQDNYTIFADKYL